MLHSKKAEGKTGEFDNVFELSMECRKGEQTIYPKLDLNECLSGDGNGELRWDPV
ncbi:hypothetical protein IMZ48_22710, partial [Candidatus Bathyarchaeota archaeon]|nr:hypothetical protein [Candidatus Bathyarchaeota archaeon]